MNLLLDTNAISELFKPKPNDGLLSLLESIPQTSQYLSVIVLGELEIGAELAPASRRNDELRRWIKRIEVEYDQRILPVDRDTVRSWSKIVASRTRIGRPVSPNDALIAATALCHNLTLITRNTADFESTGVTMVNPWT